jgi:hypothetical protein
MGSEGIRVSDPGEAEGADLDLGRSLLRWFGAPGLSYPYVPDFAIPTVHVQPPSTLATVPVDPAELYLFQQAATELLSAPTGSRFAVSYWGHGMNSYAWTVLLQRPGLRLLGQVGFGGGHGEPDTEADNLDDVFTVIRDIDGEVPGGIRRDVVVLMSDIRDVRATGWAPRNAAGVDRWLADASTSHPLLVLDDLIRRSDAWPPRPTVPPSFATRADRLAHEAQVTYEWSGRFPGAADGEDDPAADLALAVAMEPWPPLPAPHRWLPATVTDKTCWWCFGDEDEELHR